MNKPLTRQIQDSAQVQAQEWERPVTFDQVVSTGSTLLDLAISGGTVPGGGLPGRVIVQVYGPNSTGKTTLMAEVLGHVQRAGGQFRVRDPEARLNAAYCQTFGVRLRQDDIERAGTITDMFEGLIGPLESRKTGNSTTTKRNRDKAWTPDPSRINIYAVDSLAALASKMEMEQGDKMGQKRAKDFSEGFRQISDHVWNHNILMLCTDQVRDKGTDFMGHSVQDTAGGNAVGYYASLRIRLRKVRDLVKEIDLPGMEKKERHVYGIEVEAFVRKSSCDKPYRRAPIRLLFNYGLDDIGANLEWLKEHGAMSEHPTDPAKKAGYVIGDRNFVSLDRAIEHVEQNDLEEAVRETVIDLWNRLEEQIRPKRKEKVRG